MNRRVGYRFHPTDEELVDYFLKYKLNGIDFDDDIRVVDICNIEPWDLPKYAAQGSNDQVWHFFYRRELKYKSTSKPRYNRSTKTGHWKPTGPERPVKAKRSRKEIGMKRTLVFYKHGEPKELKTNWVIHEYELRKASPSKQGDWVVCKLKEKADGKADASTSLEAELSHCGASDFEIRPAAVPISQLAPQLLLQTLFPGNGVNFDQPPPSPLQPQIHIGEGFSEFQPQILLEEGISDEELMLAREIFKNGSNDGPMLTNDVFQNCSNELNYESNTIELQEDPDELPDETVNYICVLTRVTDDCNHEETASDENIQLWKLTSNTDDYNPKEAASNAYAQLNLSSSPESLSGYLEEINNMDSDIVHGRSSQYGDSNLNNGRAISTEYLPMFNVQAVTETLPPSRYKQSGTEKKHFNHDEILAMEASSAESIMDRHEKINCIGKASKKYPAIMMITHQPRSGNKTVKKKKTSRRNQIQVKLPYTYKPKAREARKHGTDFDLPCKSPKESFAQTSTSKDFQPYSFQEVCERFKAPEQSLCSIKDLQKEIKNIKLSSTSKPKAREDRKQGTDLDLSRKSPKESYAQTCTSKDFQPYSFQEICERFKVPERSLFSIQDLQEEIKNIKFSGTYKPKAREDRKHGTDLDLPRKSPKESFARTRTSKDFQPYSFQEICERLKAPERSLCSIQDLQEEIKNTKLEIQDLKKNIEIKKRIPEEGLMKYKNTQVRKNPETSLSNDKNPHEDFIKAVSVKTKRDQKKVTAKTSLKSRTDGMTSNDKICSSIDHPEISLLNQRISSISLDC